MAQATEVKVTASQRKGARLIDECKQHIIKVLQQAEADGEALGSVGIEREAGFSLDLERFNNYFTYSLVQSMSRDGDIRRVDVEGHRSTYAISTHKRKGAATRQHVRTAA